MRSSTSKTFFLSFIVVLIFAQVVSSRPFMKAGEGSQDSEATYRKMVREQTSSRIAQFNAKYSEYYTSGHNQFSELTLQEFSKLYLGGGMSQPGSPERNFVSRPQPEQKAKLTKEQEKLSEFKNVRSAAGLLNNVVPTTFSIDYSLSSNLMITNVKDQGGCGSCWAFAGIGEIESYFLKTHKLWIDLSEQQMVDCLPAVQSGNAGCGGGYLDSVGFYAAQYNIAQQKYYPYTALQGSCNTARINVGKTFKIKSYVYITDCITLANTLLTSKPIGVCGNIDQQWMSYRSGVIPNCNAAKVGGHCVLLVGAVSDGTSNANTNYWKLRNSWGVGYGQSGFLRLFRDVTDTTTGPCGICGSAIYSL